MKAILLLNGNNAIEQDFKIDEQQLKVYSTIKWNKKNIFKLKIFKNILQLNKDSQ
jgi:hypothetical protein